MSDTERTSLAFNDEKFLMGVILESGSEPICSNVHELFYKMALLDLNSKDQSWWFEM